MLKRLILAALILLGLFAPAQAASVIKSINAYTLTIAAASTSATKTITSVTAANTMLLLNGETTSGAAFHQSATRITLTNGTTVTATRGNSTNAVTVHFTVIEFASGVNSIQYGTVAVPLSSGSGTAAISAVGANAFVVWLGASTTTTGLNYNDVIGGLTLTNSTTVTATTDTLSALTVGFAVVDLGSSIVSSVQGRSITNSTTSTSYTDTITSVTPTSSMLVYGGMSSTASSLGVTNDAMTLQLTNATTVTLTRVGTNTVGRTYYYTVVSFNPSALSGSIQRGLIAQSAATSNTATITSVNPSFAMANWLNFNTGAGNPNVVQTAADLTNATTVTASTDTAGSPTTSYEVIQFAGAATAHNLTLLGVGS